MIAIRKFLLTGVLGLTGASAFAGDYCHYKYVTSYECVICYKTCTEAYQKPVTYYDHCGNPYCVYQTCYRDVQVPYKKYVPVVRKVPCY